MNKYDILQQKLESGIQVNHFLTSYGDRENNASTVAKCMSFFCALLSRLLMGL